MPLEKTSILFVDDDSSLLASLRRLLHRFGDDWQMEFCSSAQEALRHLQENRVDVVVSDIRMPKMDGTELMQLIAQNHPAVIRFILSGQAEKETILKLVDDVHQYFAKPCNPSRIIRSDAGMGMKVLKLVSTSFFGAPQPGCDISLACRTLGIDLLRSVLIKAPTTPSISPARQEAGAPTPELYQRLTNHWQVLQHSEDLTIDPDGNTTAFDYLASLWGVHDSFA